MKHTVLTVICVTLTAALCFCWGMHHAITHMQIEHDPRGTSAYVILYDNVYVHNLATH